MLIGFADSRFEPCRTQVTLNLIDMTAFANQDFAVSPFTQETDLVSTAVTFKPDETSKILNVYVHYSKMGRYIYRYIYMYSFGY